MLEQEYAADAPHKGCCCRCCCEDCVLRWCFCPQESAYSTTCLEANSTVLFPNPVMSERVDPRLRHGDVQKPAAPEKQGKDSEKTPDEEAENSKANTTPRTYDIATAKPSSEESYGLDMDR
ncbi:unnamed protein product [Sphagnum tenellum]